MTCYFKKHDNQTMQNETYENSHVPASPITSEPTDLRSFFVSELNMSLGLPFRQRAREKGETFHTVTTKLCTEDEGRFLKITTSSNRGSIGAFAYDVLNILFDLAYEQITSCQKRGEEINFDAFKVFYTNREVLRRLGLNEVNSQSYIKTAIDQLSDTKVQIKGNTFNIRLNEYLNDSCTFHLVARHRSISTNQVMFGELPEFINHSDGLKVQYVIFDKFILENLSSNFGIDKAKYLLLAPGKERRAYTYLISKRAMFGDEFSFEMNELANITGDIDRTRKDNIKKSIRGILGNIKKKIKGFDFSERTIYGKGEVEFKVSFNTREDGLEYSNPMFSELVYAHGEENLAKLGFDEHSFEIIYRELSSVTKKNKIEEIVLGKTKTDPALLFVDMALVEKIKNKNEENISELARINYRFYKKYLHPRCPDGYKYLLARNKTHRESIEKKRIEKLRRERLDREAKKKENNERFIRKAFNEKVLADESLYEKMKKAVLKTRSDLNEDNFPGILLTNAINLAIQEFMAEDMADDNGIFYGHINRNARELSRTDLNAISDKAIESRTQANLLQ